MTCERCGLHIHIGRMSRLAPMNPTHRRAGGPSPLDNVSAAVGGS